MTSLTWACVALAAVCAVADWVGVWRQRDLIIYLCKPAVMVALIAAVVVMPDLPSALRWAVVVGQLGGLAGDVALMRGHFLPGAAAFGVGHVAYIVAWLPYFTFGWSALIGLVIFAAVVGVVGRSVVTATWRRSHTLGRIVAIYQVLLGAMMVVECGTSNALLAVAAVTFAASDTLLGWSRFVREVPQLRVVVHITYHCAQIGIVVALPLLVAASSG